MRDNHHHRLLRLDSARVRSWSDEEVARRWLTLFPLRDLAGQALPVSDERVRQLAADCSWVAQTRARLGDLGWFMKCLKEPLAPLANREEGCIDTLWEGRFRSLAVLDDEALLAVAAYIALNPRGEKGAGADRARSAPAPLIPHLTIEFPKAKWEELAGEITRVLRRKKKETRIYPLACGDRFTPATAFATRHELKACRNV